MRVLRIFHSGVVDAWRERERELRRLGVEVTLLSARRWNEGGTDVELLPRPGEAVTGVRTFGRHPALFVYDPRPLWSALGQEWDVLDIHEEPFSLAAAEVLLLRALRRRRSPYTLYSAQNLDKRYPVPFRWLERWALRHAAGLSVCNAEAGRIVTRKGLPGVPSRIPLGVDLARFRPVARERGGDVVVGYVGRLAHHKGVDVLLDAVAADERLRPRIAGDGPDAAALRERARDLGLGSRVQFCGPVAQVDLPAFYAGLDVLAVPSRRTRGWVEQFCRVAVEAMACGVPVVATDTGALPDLVAGVGTLVPPDDPDALREALVRYGTDAQAAATARERGLARAAECAWPQVARAYLEMYRRAVHAPLTGRARTLEVIVVAYGAADLLAEALAPLRHLPIIVVDNSSSPDVRRVSEAAGARYVDPGWNGGFAAGVAVGLEQRRDSDSDVLLLNPDAVISADAVAALHRALAADPDLASVGPQQVGPDGSHARVAWPFPSPWRHWLEAVGLGRLGSQDDFVIGSILLLRAEALLQVGGLDPRFFLYAEETDWAYRASLLGWHHAVVPEAQARHVGAATSTDPGRREVHFHASQEHFLRKHWGALGWQVARSGQVVGAALRSVVLRGDRRRAARHRLALYLHGPAAVERADHPRPPRAEGRRVEAGAA